MQSSINSSSWNVITRKKLWRNLICSHIFCEAAFFQCSYSMIKKMLVLTLNMNTNFEHLLLPMMVYQQQHLIHQVHSSVTRVTVEEKSNFKCIRAYQCQTTCSLPQLWFTTHFSWGAVHAWSDTKIFSTQLIFFEIPWFIWCDSCDRIQNGFLRSLDSNGFSIKPISVTKIFFAELGT